MAFHLHHYLHLLQGLKAAMMRTARLEAATTVAITTAAMPGMVTAMEMGEQAVAAGVMAVMLKGTVAAAMVEET